MVSRLGGRHLASPTARLNSALAAYRSTHGATHEVDLADFDAGVADDVVGGRHVEHELRYREMKQEVGAAERQGANTRRLLDGRRFAVV